MLWTIPLPMSTIIIHISPRIILDSIIQQRNVIATAGRLHPTSSQSSPRRQSRRPHHLRDQRPSSRTRLRRPPQSLRHPRQQGIRPGQSRSTTRLLPRRPPKSQGCPRPARPTPTKSNLRTSRIQSPPTLPPPRLRMQSHTRIHPR